MNFCMTFAGVLLTLAVLRLLYSLERELHGRDFSDFNNETGVPEDIVPNIAHYVIFEQAELSFAQFICMLALLRNQLPERIYIHTNLDGLSGVYWERLNRLSAFTDRLVLNRIEMPTEVYNQTLSDGWRAWHGSDITRIRVLMEYGGVYVDNDVYVVRSLNHFRKFEMAIGWPQNQRLGNQLIIAHKDARFLKLWLETYDGAYDRDQWYYNAGYLPTDCVLVRKPHLVHRVKKLFGVEVGVSYSLFQQNVSDWKENYAFHLLARKDYQGSFQNLSDEATFPVDFDEDNVQKYLVTYREMVNEAIAYEKLQLAAREYSVTDQQPISE